IVVVVAISLLGIVTWQVVDVLSEGEVGNKPIRIGIATADAGTIRVTRDAAVASPPRNATVVAVERDTADASVLVASSAEAGTDAAVDGGSPPAAGDLVIASTPQGARVFLGGADQGVTPVRLPGTMDRHTIALVLPGHELYVAKVDGHGSFTIPLH